MDKSSVLKSERYLEDPSLERPKQLDKKGGSGQVRKIVVSRALQ
jgi:hypothetical protein